ncbi:hypothetical protein JCM6882_003493 [Rhodosporidiobolus microsporus]
MSRVTDKHKADDEDAGQLKFGASFQDTATQQNMLTISEVKLLLESLDPTKVPDNAIFNKTRDYVETFARFHSGEVVETVRKSLPNPEFAWYETVQLVNLCPMEAEEAKALIPSLKMDDETLQQHLDELSTARKQQS